MQSLKAACEKAEHILHIAKKCPQTVPHYQEKNGKTFFSIHQKLRALYEEECVRDSHQPNKHLKSCSHLLDKLVKREHLNTLIVNLYPGNKGYSIGIRMHSKSGGGSSSSTASTVSSHPSTCTTSSSSNSIAGSAENIIETMRWPYQEDELLQYIDNEELPPVLVDLLEASNPELFYSGCIIAEVRDYRQAFQHYNCDTYHVLLRPTTQASKLILCDVNLLTADGEWNTEDRLALESQLVLATQGPLCLDPSPTVSIVNNHMQYHCRALSTEPLRRCAKKFSQVSVNRKRKLDQFSVHHDMQLHDFITRRRAKTHNVSSCENGLPVPPPTPLDSTMPDLTMPEGGVDVMRFARAYERPRETNDCSPQLVEEYILESESPEGKINHIKLSILQRPSNTEYLGELYVDRDYKEKEENGTSCKFFLGTRVQANRYIQQFTEIFTEEGRKSVRITHVVPGQPTRVTCTTSMRDRNARLAQQAQHLQAQAQQLQAQAQQIQVHNQQNQLLQGASQMQSSTNVHLQMQASNHIPTQQIQSHIQVQNQHIHPHQPQVLGLSNSVVSPPPVTNNTSQSNSSVNSLSSVTPANIMNGAVVAPSVAGSSSVMPNVTNSVSSVSGAVGVGVGVSSVASQNSVSNGSASSLTSVYILLFQQLQSTPSQVQKSSSSGPRHITNPAISALVTSLMNSAQQFQQQAAAAAAAAAAAQANSNTGAASNTSAVSNSTSSLGSSVTDSVHVTSSSNNATMLSLLNSSQSSVSSTNASVNPATAQAISQKILARKMTVNLLNSRLVNHSTLPNNSVTSGSTLIQNSATGQQQQQPLRVTLSSLASPSTTSATQQAFTISSSNPGFTPLQPSNLGFSSVPISTANTGASKAVSQQAVTLNHSSRLLNSSSASRRMSVTSLGNTAAETNTSTTGSNLGLSMPGLSALLAGTPSADNPIPGSGNSASSLLERLTASSATSGTTASSPYTPLPSSSPNNQPFTSPSSKTQFLSQSTSPKNQQQQQTHFTSPSPKPPATPSPLSSPPQSSVNLNLQGLSLASLQGAMASIPGLQNVQVSIPGLAVPISLSLNVSTTSAHSSGVIVTTLPVTTTTVTCTTTTSMASSSGVSATSPLGPAGSNSTMVLTSTTPGTGSVLSLPVGKDSQLMTSSVKNLSQQNIRAAGSTAAVSLAQGGSAGGNAGSGGGSIQFVGLQRPRGLVTANQLSAAGNKQPLTARQIIGAQRHTVKMAAPNTGRYIDSFSLFIPLKIPHPLKPGTDTVNIVTVTGPSQLAASSLTSGNQVVTLTAQQQLRGRKTPKSGPGWNCPVKECVNRRKTMRVSGRGSGNHFGHFIKPVSSDHTGH
ncbi:hypothetical protein Cfor_09697 [Coptotermes formosanus]|uniref:Spt20-like SEP domain-containing protein n=1 Tax=Coptotermes formosanus TaxID=36987 RepID=A0A6L2PHY2_COPFO|nr:hypothetical protein Cfor_09697 [Coptotermes formosanus]